ncbi:MAG: PilX N-terminal domain-containing pilus assembly protein [Magnetococcus sp. THC-1_WYH]
MEEGERGSVFLIAMILLTVLTLIGVSAMNTTSLEEGMVRNSRDRQMAFHAAEAALLAGEREVESFHPVFSATCIDGYCTQACPTAPRWTDATLDVWNTTTRHRSYPVEVGGILTVPKYIIEDLCDYGSKAWREANPGWTDLPQRMYRITALGTGGTDDARVMLQSTYAVTRTVDPTCAICDPNTLPGVTTTSSSTTTSTTSSTTTTSVATTTSTTTTSVATTTSTSTTSIATTTTTSVASTTTTTSIPTTTTTTSVYNCLCKKYWNGTGRRAYSGQAGCCTNTECNNNRPDDWDDLDTNDTYWITCD